MRVKDLEFKIRAVSDTVCGEEDILYAAKGEWGKFTVMDRMTGFGWRDVETGYHDNDGKFWLATGNFDVRQFPELTVEEAIQKTKENANTCVGF